MCDATHLKSFGLEITALNKVRRCIVYTLNDIIIFFYRWFYDVLCVMLSFLILVYPPVGSSRAYMSVSLSGCSRRFLAIIRAARNFAQRMWPQATGSNPLSGSIICPSVRSSAGFFAIFVFVLISSLGVQHVAMHLYPYLGLFHNPRGSTFVCV